MSTVKIINMVHPSGSTTNIVNDSSGNVTVGNNLTVTGTNTALGPSVMAAGSTTVAPLTLQSGTNLTTATAGATEYDGKSLMFTPIGTQRGIVPGMQFFRLNGTNAGSNGTGAQSALGVGCTLSSSTIYEFETHIYMSKSAGTTSHTIALGFGGTATVNNSFVVYNIIGTSNGTLVTNAPAGNFFSVGTTLPYSFVATGAITTAAYSAAIVLRGNISVNAGGTFIPQYTLSAAPGGAYTVQAGSHMMIYPIGASGANVNVGTWA
ncbi:hypothetical protein [Caudoviricetes sp.]|nr:hypothetical protein [Caudoviricetes sp.]